MNFKLTITLMTVLFLNSGLYAKNKPNTIIKQEIIINASISQAWQLLGPEFTNAYKWASSINHSEAQNNESINGSSCSERGCDVSGIGKIKEKILIYSEKEHKLSYEVYEGMPGMVKYAANTWTLTESDNGTTKLQLRIEMKTGGMMGWMMNGMMVKKMTKLSAEIAEEFTYYVENGKPHPRKIKASKK